jgi:hypothetical protein
LGVRIGTELARLSAIRSRCSPLPCAVGLELQRREDFIGRIVFEDLGPERRAQFPTGPKPGSQIEEAAAATGIPERSLIAAADALDVRCRRGEWWLPGQNVAPLLSHSGIFGT